MYRTLWSTVPATGSGPFRPPARNPVPVSQLILSLGDSVAATNILGNSVASNLISLDISSPPGYIVAAYKVAIGEVV